MSDRVAAFLNDLNDPAKYVRVPDVVIFDAHQEIYWVDKHGRSVPEGTPGARKKVRKFARADLERIAKNCNARDRTGTFSPLAFGHTDPDQPDETKQPEPVGVTVGYRVAYSPRLRRDTLRTNFYVRKEKWDEAKTYPRVSIELWPSNTGEEVIDPVALLRRTPQRDLGNWVYHRRGKPVLRYSMEAHMDDDLEPGMGPPQSEEGPEGEMTPEEVEQYERHAYSHPLARRYHAHKARMYAMQDPTPGVDEDELPDPTRPPDASLEEPEQYGASYPSGTNGAPPRPGQYRKDAESVRYARMESRLHDMEAKAAIAEARQVVTQLVAEGYDLDPGVEVPEFARCDEKGREARARHIRRYYRQAPVENYGRVSVEPTGDPEPDDSPRLHEGALRYMRERPGLGYEEALAAVRKNGRAG